jgi:antitoxin component YwqK of YwqJK toxin-antitoxin module
MKILLTLLLSLISFSFSQEPINYETTLIERDGVYHAKATNEPYSGKVFSIYDDGKIKNEGTLKDGKMISRTEWKWYENGQKWSELNYKGGRVDGIFNWWYDNGQKQFEGTYKNGLKDGLNTSWYENGQMSFESNYTKHLRDGAWTSWYENGQKNSEGNYKDGKFDGSETVWHKNGQKYRESKFEGGKLISEKQWNEDGSVKD